MIKHSFVRSSKKPRNAFTMSVQQSPTKHVDSVCLEHKRTDSVRFDVTTQSKQNAQRVGKLVRFPHRELIQHPVYTQNPGQTQTKQDRIKTLKGQLKQLNNLMCKSKTLEIKSFPKENKSSQDETRMFCGLGQSKTQDIFRGTEDSLKPGFKIVDSDEQESIRFGRADSSGKVSKQMCVADNNKAEKQRMQEWQLRSISMGARICKVQQAVTCLGEEVRMIKARQENFLQLFQKFGEEIDVRMRNIKQSFKTETQEVAKSEVAKSEITKNNQVLSRMRSGTKELEEAAYRRDEEYQLQVNFKINALQGSMQDMRSTVSSELHRLETTCKHLQRDVFLVVESTVEEFKTVLETVKAQESQLTCISRTLIDIVRLLVDKTSKNREQKPLQVIDLLRSNIGEIQALKSEQLRLSKRLNHMPSSPGCPPIKQQVQRQVALHK